ncbi:MAG: phosphoglucomutase (alpha-D-glucose-1,6-bisphosphate-dependent) [Arenimonas sp.]
MSPHISPLAGKRAQSAALVDITKLVAAYYSLKPDSKNSLHRVTFGTSGHRGSSFNGSFNENHILAISQAICEYRHRQGINGPLFIGIDTHALSKPAFENVLEVMAANSVEIMVSQDGEYTPTPTVSHAILSYNRGRTNGFADGIVVTPSHNPPEDGGIKYNPTHGGPADSIVTGWIQDRANAILEAGMKDVVRIAFKQAQRASNTHQHDFLTAYVDDLKTAIDFDLIRASGIRMGVDPLGGAGLHYWARIAERYQIDLTVINEQVDPQFGFMSLDWDGKIRMDPSSSYAMRNLVELKDRYDVAFACDTDHDRHGIVTPSVGLLPANHFLSVAIDYLFQHRPQWSPSKAIGKTVVSSAMIDRVAKRLGRELLEVPVGFKWFADGLFDGSLGFAGEESSGATFLRRDGSTWTTDKDGIVLALLSAEMTALHGRDPGLQYQDLCKEFGDTFSDRVEAKATADQKQALSKLTPSQIVQTELADELIENVIDKAPGNNGAIGGIKVSTKNGWFAARPSGTEDIYKIYAESFRDDAHLRLILEQAQSIVDAAIA